MRTVVISDIHLGSRHCKVEALARLLDRLPAGDTLVLNGDTMDSTRRPLPPSHRAALDRLVAESRRRTVIWVQGNHDEDIRLPDPGAFHFAVSHAVGQRLYVQHGFYFDRVMPYHKLFIVAFRLMHRLRITLGAEPVHVAQYAKKWSVLYGVLRRNVLQNALRFAREHGYTAVTCGHTHFAESRQVGDILYMNTGAWTETPVYAVVADENRVGLHAIDTATGQIDPEPIPPVRNAAI